MNNRETHSQIWAAGQQLSHRWSHFRPRSIPFEVQALDAPNLVVLNGLGQGDHGSVPKRSKSQLDCTQLRIDPDCRGERKAPMLAQKVVGEVELCPLQDKG